MNNVNKSEGDNSDFFGVNRSVLSPMPKLGTMGSNWGEVRVTGFLYHLKKPDRMLSRCECRPTRDSDISILKKYMLHDLKELDRMADQSSRRECLFYRHPRRRRPLRRFAHRSQRFCRTATHNDVFIFQCVFQC